MLIHIVRHGRTAYSATYRLNGDPRVPVPLDHEGVAQCRVARDALLVAHVAICVASPFLRTRQTADLLTMGHHIPIVTDARLGELDYGRFEGRPFTEYADWLPRHGPWARPPGAGEAQREGIRRMIGGLRAALDHPRPLLVVTHGLLASVLRHGATLGDALFFPEAPYLTPLSYTPNDLARLLDDLDAELDRSLRGQWAGLLGVAGPVGPVSVGRTPDYPEKEDSHA